MASFKNSEVYKNLRSLWADRRPYKTRLLYAGAVMLAACFTFIFFGPLEMVAFSGSSLTYGYKDILGLLALAASAVFVAGSLILALLRGKIYNIAVSLVLGATVCGYLQAALFNGSLGTLTGDAIDWFNMKMPMLLNFAFWFVVIAVVFLVMYLSRKVWKKLLLFAAILLVIMQSVPAATILLGGYDSKKNDSTVVTNLTTDGMYEYSKADNIFVFVLDRFDYDYLEAVLKDHPDFLNKLDGFTQYTNATPTFARTQPALNHMFTGNDEAAYRVPSADYFKDSWTANGNEILADLDKAGYSIDLYTKTSYLFSDYDYARQYVSNADQAKQSINNKAMLKKLMYLSAYRYAPTALKPFFHRDTNYFNSGVFVANDSVTYTFNDAVYAPGFLDATADDKEKNFKFYHFMGPHAPYNLKADGTASDTPTSVTEQLMGSFHNLYAAFDQMKELGIYKDATIIILGDHGDAKADNQPVSKATRIGLFYKPSGSADTPLSSSAAQVCSENIPATLVKAAGGNYAPYGKPLDEVGEDEEITRYHYKSISSNGSADEVMVYKYAVTGDASDINNWKVVETFDVAEGGKFY